MNVGATSETDYGDYFMWGSTTPNTNTTCDWTNTPFNNGSDSYNEEYFTTHKSEWLDSKDNLKSKFDAVTQIMGGDWRMPTEAEIQELIDYTTNEWFTNYKGTGVKGRKFTGSNGNSIFIPAAGNRYGGSVSLVGYDGYIWGSSLYAPHPTYAWYLHLSSGKCNMDNYSRCNGHSMRGVL